MTMKKLAKRAFEEAQLDDVKPDLCERRVPERKFRVKMEWH